MRLYNVDVFTEDQTSKLVDSFTDDKENNPVVVETAGFVPLEIRFKQMEQAGYRAQFAADDFTSSELREIYFGPNTEIYPGDEMEVIEEKLYLQNEMKLSILQSKERNSVVSGTETAESSSLTLEKVESKDDDVKKD